MLSKTTSDVPWTKLIVALEDAVCSLIKVIAPVGKLEAAVIALIELLLYLTKDIKDSLFKEHGKSEKDSGSAEGQIALFTTRINHLTNHLKKNKKDFNTERSLVKMVGKRKSLLNYLKSNDIERYRSIIKKLSIRK